MGDLDATPLALQQSTRCVTWKREIRDGKPTKVPYCPRRPAQRAAVDDPSTWSTFAEARGAYEAGAADGVGIVLGDDLAGVDIDDCRTPDTGELTADAQDIIDTLASYAEASPSGTGVHVLVRGTLPPGRRRKGPVEMYCEGRYFTVTGDHLPGTPTTIEERTAALAAVHATYLQVSATVDLPQLSSSAHVRDLPLLGLDNSALLERARAASNGGKFSRLYAGNWSGEYDSQSEADQALCNLLAFWAGADAGRMDTLFRQSGLMRPKWDSGRGESTYGRQTIATAIAGCRDSYTGPQGRRSNLVSGGNDVDPPDRSQPDDRLVLTDVATLLAEGDDTIEYLVEDRFACGSVNLIAGRPKAGKSTLARALALAVARSDRWLGSRCRFGRVIYVALEDKRSEVRRHLRAMGATGQEPIRFLIGSAPKTLLADLADLITSGDSIDLLIIDTAQRLLTVKDTNDYALVTAAFEPVLALARTHGTCIVLLHHAGKADRAGIETILGSTAWAASVDNVLLLNRTDRYRLVSSVQRIGPDLGETVVLMDEQTGDVRLGGSRYLVDLQTITTALYDVVAGSGDAGIRRDDLLAAVEARREKKLKALQHLTDDPTIVRLGAGTKTDPHRYQLVREPQSATPTNSDSGSGVPLKRWEPESSSRVLSIPVGVDSGSRKCAGSEVPRGRF